MRVVIQRVLRATLFVENKQVAAISKGMVVLLGITHADGEEDVGYICKKCAALRIFEDEHHKMNRALAEVGGEILLVSQFTVYGDVRRGNRPAFDQAAPPEKAEKLYEHCIKCLKDKGLAVQTGIFGANMQIELVNDGPVTLILDSKKIF